MHSYTTWVVDTWIANTRKEEEYWSQAAARILESSNGDEVYSKRDVAVETLAKLMLEEVIDGIPEEVDGFYRDVLVYGLEDVDWYEIADSFIESQLNPQEAV